MEHGPFEDVFPIEHGDFPCYVSLLEGNDFQLSCPLDPLFTAGLCVISFCRASIFLHQKKALRPSVFHPAVSPVASGGKMIGTCFFFKDDLTFPIQPTYIPYQSALLSGFVFRTSQGKICGCFRK